MKYKLMARSRPDAADDVAAKHQRFMAALGKLPRPLTSRSAERPPAKEPGSQFLVTVPLTRLLGLRSLVRYANRWYLPDEAAHDDWFKVEFNPETVAYHELVRSCVKPLIAAFGAYVLTVEDERFTGKYFEQWRAKPYDDRDGVFTISPVSYFDRELCRRAFGLGPAEVTGRLAEVAEHVEVYRGGALVILSSEPLAFEEADDLCRAARRRLPASSKHRRRSWRPPRRRERFKTIGESLRESSGTAVARAAAADPALAGQLMDYSPESGRRIDRFLRGLQSRPERLTKRQWGEVLRWRSAYWHEMIQRSNHAP